MQHTKRRKLLSHTFSSASIATNEPIIRDEVKLVLSKITDSVRAGEILDVAYLFRTMAFDVVGLLFFGRSFGAVHTKSASEVKFMSDADLLFIEIAIRNIMPSLYRLLPIIPLPEVKRLREAYRGIIDVR